MIKVLAEVLTTVLRSEMPYGPFLVPFTRRVLISEGKKELNDAFYFMIPTGIMDFTPCIVRSSGTDTAELFLTPVYMYHGVLLTNISPGLSRCCGCD